MVTNHITAKEAAIRPPAIISTQAKGWKILMIYHELTSTMMAANGIATTAHLNHTGRTYAWVNMSPTMKKMNGTPNRWMCDTRTSVEMLAPVSTEVTFLRLSSPLRLARCGLLPSWQLMQRRS